jgi:hypothetical protein
VKVSPGLVTGGLMLLTQLSTHVKLHSINRDADWLKLVRNLEVCVTTLLMIAALTWVRSSARLALTNSM